MIEIQAFIQAVLQQNRERLREFFCEDAYVNWHGTNERFTVEEYIRANCEYPGTWDGEIESIDRMGDLFFVVTRVFPMDRSSSFHCVSRICCKEDKICSLDEWWADDGVAPRWRREMNIGVPIRKEEEK